MGEVPGLGNVPGVVKLEGQVVIVSSHRVVKSASLRSGARVKWDPASSFYVVVETMSQWPVFASEKPTRRSRGGLVEVVFGIEMESGTTEANALSIEWQDWTPDVVEERANPDTVMCAFGVEVEIPKVSTGTAGNTKAGNSINIEREHRDPLEGPSPGQMVVHKADSPLDTDGGMRRGLGIEFQHDTKKECKAVLAPSDVIYRGIFEAGLTQYGASGLPQYVVMDLQILQGSAQPVPTNWSPPQEYYPIQATH